jgi:hypothetical protein
MTTPDAIERLHDLAINKWADGISVNDARTILDHITALTAECDAAVAANSARPAIVRIDPAQYEDGLYLNPVTGAVMWVAVRAPVGGE